jgi:hypothetical protein
MHHLEMLDELSLEFNILINLLTQNSVLRSLPFFHVNVALPPVVVWCFDPLFPPEVFDF